MIELIHIVSDGVDIEGTDHLYIQATLLHSIVHPCKGRNLLGERLVAKQAAAFASAPPMPL